MVAASSRTKLSLGLRVTILEERPGVGGRGKGEGGNRGVFGIVDGCVIIHMYARALRDTPGGGVVCNICNIL